MSSIEEYYNYINTLFTIEETIKDKKSYRFYIQDYIKERLSESCEILFIQDNAGKTILHKCAKLKLDDILYSVLKLSPEAIKIQDNLGNTCVHEAADDSFSLFCLKVINVMPEVADIKNFKGETFIDVYGAGELKGSCASMLRLCGGRAEELKLAHKYLCEKYPEAEDPYSVAFKKYREEQEK